MSQGRELYWSLVISCLLAAGCGKNQDPTASLGGNARSRALDSTRGQQALSLLSTKCAGCHSFTNLATLIQTGMIVPGSSQSSPIYQRVADRSMPPGAPLGAPDLNLLKAWIDEDLAPTPTPRPTVIPTAVPTPIPTPVPTVIPTVIPTPLPTLAPTPFPTALPSSVPTPVVTPNPSSTPGPAAGITYYKEVKPILDAKCAICHQSGGVDEILLDSYEHLAAGTSLIAAQVSAKKMPPGQSTVDASPLLDRSRYLTASETTTILSWIQSGAPAGNPSDNTSTVASILSLPRVDATVQMTEPYTPQEGDDYEIFTIPWTQSSDTFVTGFQVVPGPDVHHILLYTGGSPAGGRSLFQVGPYNIFGFTSLFGSLPRLFFDFLQGKVGSSRDNSGSTQASSLQTVANMNLIGAFVPGIGAQTFAKGMGVRIPASSSVSMQIHYNSSHNPNGKPSGPDQTAIHFMLQDQVQTEAKVMPVVNPLWMIDHSSLSIPAGKASVTYSSIVDPFALYPEFKRRRTLHIYSAIAHMHLHGKQAALNIVSHRKRANFLYVPHYDFQFQMNYRYAAPIPITRGQKVEGVCQWDNSATGQPILNGKPVPMQDMQWGEKTTDEMCLFGVYVAP